MADKIRVHEKALAHLSRGLYRSPASALRELVSNAWDANATTVQLSTNYPNFLQITVRDNGDGFTRSEFQNLMRGGIGNSAKREETTDGPKTLKYGRAIIGKLGIGMLGIAQICGSFTVRSRTKTGEGFQARVKLYDLLRERLDAGDDEIVKDGADDVKEVDVGEYEFLDDPSSDSDLGTSIIADDVHPTFARAFQEATTFKGYKPPPLDWRRCVSITHQKHSVQELGEYWRLLWELAVATPVPYLSERAIPNGLIVEDQRRLLSHKFSVIADGRELAKPVNLRPGRDYTTVRIAPPVVNIYGRALRFHGYIVVQEGEQIRPDELRGILVRIRNVAVGYCDPSLLGYRINQGPRSRWITGEIFVDEGLEDALNIDRDSFNQFHPQYRRMQSIVHERLSEEIFPEVYKKILMRSKVSATEKNNRRSTLVRGIVADVVKKRVAVRTASKPEEDGVPRVHITDSRETLDVELPMADTVPTKKADRQLASCVLVFFEIAMRERSPARRRNVFTQLLMNFLKGW